MSNRRIDQRLEEAAISTAVAEMLEQEGKKIQEELDNIDESEKIYPDKKHQIQLETALNKAYRNWKFIQFFKQIRTPVRRVMTVLTAVIIVFSISVVSVEAFRVKFIDWLIGLSDTHTMVKSIGDDSAKYNDVWNTESLLNNLPVDYSFQSTINENDILTTTFVKDNYMLLLIQYTDKQTINVDSEESQYISYVDINGYDGLLISKNNSINLTWYNNEYSYVIYSDDPNVTQEQIIKIAENIK